VRRFPYTPLSDLFTRLGSLDGWLVIAVSRIHFSPPLESLRIPGVWESVARGLQESLFPVSSLLLRVVLLCYFPNPAGAFEHLKEVIVLLVLQLVPVKDSLREVQQPSDLGVGGIGNVPKRSYISSIQLGCFLVGKFPGGDLYGFL